MIKRYALFLCMAILALMLAGCPAGTGGPTDPTSAAPTLLEVRTSASQIPRGQLLIFYVTYVDLTGDLNGGAAVVTDDEKNRYDSLVSNAEPTSGELTINITVNNLLTPNQDHVFTIVVFDRGGNISNSRDAIVYILP